MSFNDPEYSKIVVRRHEYYTCEVELLTRESDKIKLSYDDVIVVFYSVTEKKKIKIEYKIVSNTIYINSKIDVDVGVYTLTILDTNRNLLFKKALRVM